jgi:flavin-dependent dehydrogenase
MRCDATIIGGGLAGLSLAVDLAIRGASVVVIEKGTYPRHKVCGEYISLESLPYLGYLCPEINDLDLPRITSFRLTSVAGKPYDTALPMGGFGISRYLLEQMLYERAISLGVHFYFDTVKATTLQNNKHIVQAGGEEILSRLLFNATGRKSNFEAGTTGRNKVNYVGVKYHVRIARESSLIEIHNFPGGYCGISNVEEGKSCLCYLVNSAQLRSCDNDITLMEKTVLAQNPHLGMIFHGAEFLGDTRSTISNITFRIKQAVAGHVFFLGDSAGSTAPVTGNGMSMAMRAASCLAGFAEAFLAGQCSREQMEQYYEDFRNRSFGGKIRLSRHFQRLSEYPLLTRASIHLFRALPVVGKSLIRLTHGEPF